jgi:hypothetical protein
MELLLKTRGSPLLRSLVVQTKGSSLARAHWYRFGTTPKDERVSTTQEPGGTDERIFTSKSPVVQVYSYN